ncbi:MAG: sugar MFS transporter [Tannerella sp.]|jgi:glucose/galactose transporter|nr:sugar MFS transporter [Tannerella sp.]
MNIQGNQTLNKQNTRTAIIIVGAMFFIFGFVSWVNAILIPYFKIACELTYLESYFVAFAFYIAYLLLSVPASWVLKRAGYKRGIMYGFFCMAAGAFLFVPAALYRTYGIFLTGLFMLGTGLTILQSAANPYITIAGPIESAAKRMSIMGICNKFAGIISPLIFAAVVLKVTDSELFTLLDSGTLDEAVKNRMLDDLIRRVILPYIVLGVFLFLFGLYVRFSVLPEINPEDDNRETATNDAPKKSVFQFPYLVLGAIALFMHVGTQVIAIDTIIGYAKSMGMDLLEAKAFPSYVLTATIVGYMLGIILIPKYVSQTNALRFCTILGLLFSTGIIFVHKDVTILGHNGDLSIWFLCALGLPNSLIYAGIWPLSIKGLGRFTKIGSSFLVMALCGNAIMPVLYGYIADQWNVRDAYWILIPCYLYLIYFALHGHLINSWSLTKKKSV